MRNSVFCLLLVLGLISFSGIAATNIVTSTADNGAGSLRQVISSSSSGDTVTFAITGTITLTNSELVINKSLTVQGPGSGLLSIERSSAIGTPDFRIFNIQAG